MGLSTVADSGLVLRLVMRPARHADLCSLKITHEPAVVLAAMHIKQCCAYAGKSCHSSDALGAHHKQLRKLAALLGMLLSPHHLLLGQLGSSLCSTAVEGKAGDQPQPLHYVKLSATNLRSPH